MILTRAALVVLPLLSLFCAATVHWLGHGPGEDLLIQRKYKEAAVLLQDALAEAPLGEQDRILFLLGEAQLLAGENKAAVSTFRRMAREQVGSDLVVAARFLEARALEEDGELRQAAAIYRDQIERLIGLQRKEEVAATYLGLAEKAQLADQPDHNRVVTFCDLALDLGLKPATAVAARLKAAEAKLSLGDHADAIRRLGPLVDELDVQQGRLRAMLALGKARRLAGDHAGARTVLRDLRRVAPSSDEAADSAYEIALSFGVPQPAPALLDRAVSALEVLREQHPTHEKAKTALFLTAQCYRHAGRDDDSLAALREFLAAQGDEDLDAIPAARAMVGDVLSEQGKVAAAIAAWRDYLSQHPSHGEWERVQRAIVDGEYRMAIEAYALGKDRFAEVRERLTAFERAYPLDPRNPAALYLQGSMLVQEEKFAQAGAAFARCVSKYPGREESSRAQLAIGEIYETKTFDYEQALKAYRAVTWGKWQQQARQRIVRLEQKQLYVRTERVFQTDESPVFELVSRNIESVRVRVFRLDLEDYFRAVHSAGSVDRLDIEVIAPQHVFDSEVPEYLRYRETTRNIELGFAEPGAYVVKVDDRELEAVTMVLVSDLALVTKSSRHELFAFTQNTKEDRAEGGVKVVVSDGSKIVAEGLTGADGVYRWRGEELQNHDRLAVFAVNGAGSGAGTVDLSGLGYSVGLVPKGYLFTDRPLYQPGQRVHFKGIVREVEDGLYRLPEIGGYRAQVWSPDGRLVLQRDVEFTDFGTFVSELDLPESAPLGSWRIGVDRPGRDELVFTSSFEVARYERPRLQLGFELERPLVFRGETIEGRVIASWFYGEPAVGRELVYRMTLPDGVVIEKKGMTNAAGEVAFSLPTTEFGEEAIAWLSAELPADAVATQVAVPVVTTEFAPSLSTVRQVYLANEPFEVSVKIEDRAGKPLKQRATAILLRLEQPERHRSGLIEVEVARRAIETAADGTVRAVFTAEQGGRYRVRVEATDRFGNLVSGALPLVISDDDDEVKLRLLCDRESFSTGEQATVRVANRAGAKLALLCWQGDGILAYETRVLPAGESTLQLELRPEHAPNFALALAMVDGRQLHTAERSFRVHRALQVDVDVAEQARPGEKVAVSVRTLDPQGQPVAAEVALSMVDESLLAVRAGQGPSISEFFYGNLRETEFRTNSSCTWSYSAPSRSVNEALLVEERRRGRAAGESVPGESSGDIISQSLAFVASQLQSVGSSRQRSNLDRAGQDSGRQLMEQMELQSDGTVITSNHYRGRTITGGLPFQTGQYQVLLGQTFGRPQLGSTAWFKALAPGGVLELASDEPRVDFRATGAWISALVTDADGKASVEIELPDSTTGWRIDARAVTRDTWVGQGDARLRTQQELQVDLVGPAVLTEGDRTEFGVRMHNLTASATSGRVELSVSAGDARIRGGNPVSLAAGGEATSLVEYSVASGEDLVLELEGSAGAHDDRMERAVAVLPYGVEVVDGRSGSTRDQAAFELGLAEGREYSALRMLVELGPDPGRDLVRAALGGGYQPWNCRQVAMTNLTRSSRGLAALSVLDYLGRGGQGVKTDRDRLRGLAQNQLQALVGAQREDGSVAWIGKIAPDFRSTSQAVRFFAACRRHGLSTAAEPMRRAADWLLQALRTANNEMRPDIVWALAEASRVRFESLNSLHRARAQLDPDGLARLALAWHAFGRAELAAELGDAMRAGLRPEVLAKTNTQTMAQLARALLLVDKRDIVAVAAVGQLSNVRQGAAWGTPGATAAAIDVLTLVRGTDAGGPRATEISVVVNGKELVTTPRQAQGLDTAIPVPADWLQERGNKVTIAVAGGGEAFYSVSLIGFARGFTAEDRNDERIFIERKYLVAGLRHDGRPVEAGFGVMTGRGYQTFENPLTQLRVGETGRVQTRYWLRRRDDRERTSPFVLEEPIPAGCSVPRASITGSFDHVSVQPDRLVFYFREASVGGTVEYQLQARFPGKYRALPTTVYSALRPELRSFGAAGELLVHRRGEGGLDDYRLTPSELYHLGKALFDAAQPLSHDGAAERRRQLLEGAQGHLDELLKDWHKKDFRLRDDVFKDVARMMLFVGIERHDNRAVVRYFEELKDRYAELVIPFDKMLAVGKSYFDLGEFEAALLVFRATAETSFLKDAAVATTLESLGEVRAGTDFLEKLLRTYPDLNTMRIARYSIGQKLAAMAAAMDPEQPVDSRVGSVDELRERSLRTFREFLVLHPEDPLAEEVSFAWATTDLEGKDLQAALAVATAALERYPGSTFTDEMLYTQGYAQFALGEHDEAFAALQRVATEQFPDDRGRTGDSESKWHAVYLQGQIHHARGEPERALAAYERVEDRFTDAGEARDYFLRKHLGLPEVVTFGRIGEPVLDLEFRNVATASLQVYKVDLMRLYLLEKSLNDIRGIQLHGIAPLLAFDVELGDGRDYKGNTKKVPLELSEPGAYLVVARGYSNIATGMVLVSDLAIEAQEQLDNGRIRVNVKQGDAFLADAHVKVIGSEGGEFKSGETDLRGVFVGNDLIGTATVIAKKDDQYAFFRGTGVHQPSRVTPPVAESPQSDPQGRQPARNGAKDFDALEQNIRYNFDNRARQVQWLEKEVLNKKQQGVEVYRTK